MFCNYFHINHLKKSKLSINHKGLNVKDNIIRFLMKYMVNEYKGPLTKLCRYNAIILVTSQILPVCNCEIGEYVNSLR
jgi:hypothetical protein